MMIVRLIFLLVLLPLGRLSHAVELDPLYYPQRIEWHNIEQLEASDWTRNAQISFSNKVLLGEGFSRAFIHWQHGRYLRIRVDATTYKNIDQLTLWYSTDTGLYQELKPVKTIPPEPEINSASVANSESVTNDENVVLFVRPQVSSWQVMLQKQDVIDGVTSVAMNLAIDQTVESEAPLLDVAGPAILHASQQVKTSRSDGIEQHNYNEIHHKQALEYELVGPAQYALIVRTPWIADYGLSTELAMTLSLGEQKIGDTLTPKTVAKIIPVRPQTDYLLQTEQCDCVYSKEERVNVFVPAGTHKIAVSADKEILAQWREINQPKQYFYSKNHQQKYEKHGPWLNSAHPQLIPEPMAADSVATQFFYRELSPEVLNTESPSSLNQYQPLVFNRFNAVNWLPNGYYGDLSRAYFSEINAGNSSKYLLPVNNDNNPVITSSSASNSPTTTPVRLMLKALSVDKTVNAQAKQSAVAFSLTSFLSVVGLDDMGEDRSVDSKDNLKEDKAVETVNFIYLPESQNNLQLSALTQAKLTKLKSAPNAEFESKALAPITTEVATALVNLKQPYNSVKINNTSETAFELNLAYKTASKLKTDEADFFELVRSDADSNSDSKSADVLIEHLKNGTDSTYNSVISNKPIDTSRLSPILAEEIKLWQTRLNSRAESFARSYPPFNQDKWGSVDVKVKEVMVSLSQFNGESITQLPQLNSLFQQQGMKLSAKRLLAGLALQKNVNNPWQQQAQELLLNDLTAEQRWADIEGYWAYRLINFDDVEAIAPISQMLFRQNLFAQANKWYWLAYQADLFDEVPSEALLSAGQSSNPKTLINWLCGKNTHADNCLFNQAKAGDSALLPTLHTWQSVDIENIEGSGRELLYLNGLDTYFTATKLTNKKQLPLNISSKQALKFTLYPTTSVNNAWTENNWFIVKTNQQTRRYPMSELNDSLGVSIANKSSQKVASRTVVTLTLAPEEVITAVMLQNMQAQKTHSQKIQAQNVNLAFTLHQQAKLEPKLLTCLSQTQTQTLAVPKTLAEALESKLVIGFDERQTSEKFSQLEAYYQSTCANSSPFDQYAIAFTPYLSGNESEITVDNLLRQIKSTLVARSNRATDVNVEPLLLQALWLKQQAPLTRELVTALNALAPTKTEHLSWLSAINSNYQWKPLQSVIRSAGTKVFATDIWQGRSEYQRLQQSILLSQTLASGERLLSSSQVEVIQLDSVRKQQIEVSFRQPSRLGGLEFPVTLAIEHNGSKQQITLLPDEIYQQTLVLKAGANTIRLSVVDPLLYRQSPWVFFAVKQLSKAQPSENNDGNSILPTIKDAFLMASATNSLQVHIPEQSWVRIDERDANGHQQAKTQYFPSSQTLTLSVNNDAKARYFKIYHWQEAVSNSAKREVPSDIASTMLNTELLNQPTTAPVIAPAINAIDNTQASYQLLNAYHSNRQEDGSWGVFAGYTSRSNFDEDEQTSKERFYQLGARYQRKFDHWNSFLTSELSLRKHDNDDLKTLVIENDGLWQLSKFWQVGASLNGYYQLDAREPVIDGAWSSYASLNVNWRQYWHDTTDNKLSLTAFNRSLSLDENELSVINSNLALTNGQSIDDDVYSNYKADHAFGLRLSDTLRYSPWQDTQLRLQGALTSDNKGNFLNAHKLSVSVGLRQYWQPFTGKIDLQQSRYFRDENDASISTPANRSTLKMGLVWDQWTKKGQLWQVETTVNHNMNDNDTSLVILLRWGETYGQGFDDFHPDSVSFSSLRKRDSYQAIDTNQVIRADHE